jgi:hypothetical protein
MVEQSRSSNGSKEAERMGEPDLPFKGTPQDLLPPTSPTF